MIRRFQNGATFWNRPRNKIVDIVIFVENFESFVGPGFCENQKMVLVNGDQYPKRYLWSIVYWNLKNVKNPTLQAGLSQKLLKSENY